MLHKEQQKLYLLEHFQFLQNNHRIRIRNSLEAGTFSIVPSHKLEI